MDKNRTFGKMPRLLCSRHKRVAVSMLPTGKQLHVVAEMEDSVHHLRIDMVVNQPSLRICSIECDMQSIPDQICCQSQNFFERLIGRRVKPGLVGELKQEANTGCTHLTDLLHDACYNLTMAQGVVAKEELTAIFPDITNEQMYKIFLLFKPELYNSCVRYAESSPFMERVNNAGFPEEAKKIPAIASRLTPTSPKSRSGRRVLSSGQSADRAMAAAIIK